ncbi:MAG: hypothetical protein E7372_01175 [Clostridiales bacterium]|nr:hypothetical protein [Clostridiales bacterium]
MKQIIKNPFKILTIICSFVGIIICLSTARYDGYSHPSRRLLYFTNQSNIWIFIIMTLSLFTFSRKGNYNKYSMFIARYIFITSIILTAVIFCCFLGPFADKSYHAWSVSGILTHIAVPLFAVIDFFTQNERFFINKKVALLSIIPPLFYLILTTILFYFNIDFGRGENFPYFFFNYHSPAGFFGFSSVSPYFIGSFYWIILMFLLLLFFAFLLIKMNNKIYLKRDKTT